MLNNYKTYIVAISAGAVVMAQALGWIDAEALKVLYGLLGAVGLGSIRHAIQKAIEGPCKKK